MPKLSKRQKFVMQRINRKEIKNAPYNPRTIDTHARRKLEKNIKVVGLIGPITVNKLSMNIVSGHKRLASLDALEGTDNYLIDVAMVEMTDQQEKSQNVFMNNPSAQGTWDLDALGTLLKEIETPEDTGFDPMDIQVMFEDSDLATMFDTEAQAPEVKEAVDDIQKIADIKAAKKKGIGKALETNDSECYTIVVFKDREDQSRFMEACGVEADDRYMDGAVLRRLLGMESEKKVEEVKKKLWKKKAV